MTVKYLRPLLLILVVVAIAWFYFTDGDQYLRLEYLQGRLQAIRGLYQERPVWVILIYSTCIVLFAALSIPGSIVLTLLAGAIFGVLKGAAFVCLASVIGATLAFLMARFLFKEMLERRFQRQYLAMDRKIAEEGALYLFTLRLIPVSPFVVVNLLMGLTSMKPMTYMIVTFIGMDPGTLIYVYAGRKFSEIESIKGILSFPIVGSLLALGLLPIIAKYVRRHWKQPRSSYAER